MVLSDTPRETSIVQPDLVYLAPDRLDRVSGRGIEGGSTLVDPDARAIEAFVLEGDRYILAAGAAGPDAVDLPPFTGLGLVPDSLWP